MVAEANIRAVITADDKASRVLAGFGKSVKVAATVAGAAISFGIVKNLDDAIRRVDTLNNSKRVFQAMGFSAKEVQGAMKNLDLSIRGLPTTLDSAVRGVQLLAASTNDIGKSQKIFSALNNAIIGFGGSAESVEGAIIQLSQAFSNGKVDAQTWNSLIQNNLGPALNAIARDMGITTGKLKEGLSEGTISVKQFQDALIEMNVKGGGGMKSFEKLAKDATGGIGTSWSNMQTAITRGIANIINAIGSANIANLITNIGKAFEGASASIINFGAKTVDIANQAKEFLMPNLRALWNTISIQLIPALTNLWKNVIQPLIPVIGTTLVIALGLAIDALNLLISVISPVIGWLGKNKAAVYAVIGAFTLWYATMKITAGFNAMFNSLAILRARLFAVQAQAGGTRGTLALLNKSLTTFGGFGIIAAAAIYAGIKIVEAANKAKKAWNDALNTMDVNSVIESDATKELQRLVKHGTPKQKAAAKKSLAGIAGNRAHGGPVDLGRSYLVGEKGPEIFTPKRSGQIIPNKESQNMMSNQTINFNVNIGMYAGSEMEKRKVAKTLFDAYNDLMKANLAIGTR